MKELPWVGGKPPPWVGGKPPPWVGSLLPGYGTPLPTWYICLPSSRVGVPPRVHAPRPHHAGPVPVVLQRGDDSFARGVEGGWEGSEGGPERCLS